MRELIKGIILNSVGFLFIYMPYMLDGRIVSLRDFLLILVGGLILNNVNEVNKKLW